MLKLHRLVNRRTQAFLVWDPPVSFDVWPGSYGEFSLPLDIKPDSAVAQWKFIVKTDLSSAIYQIPLAKESIKYCGVVVVTPFRAIRMYTRCAMLMPVSETALKELMCRV